MTRMIERWFPCQEVSQNSAAGWGSGNAERNLFTWFAARPTAQAKAAVICSLLPWPDDESEQKRLQALVREAMTGRYAARDEIQAEILKANPDGASMLDPFSGRGMIPLEAARLGIEAHAIEYSPVAYLASKLLTDYPFRDWRSEPELPYASKWRPEGMLTNPRDTETAAARYYRDVEATLREVGARHAAAMAEFYPKVNGKQPWGYLWTVTLPCQECGHRFPLVGSYNLRLASLKKATKRRAEVNDPGQSYYIDADPETGTFTAVVHEGPPRKTPTLANAVVGGKKVKGKTAVCPFCGHGHPLETHKRLAREGRGVDALLVVAEHDDNVGKVYRPPAHFELSAVEGARKALATEASVSPLLPASPEEKIPLNSGATIRPQLYGADSYGDLMVARQTLSFVRLSKAIREVAAENLMAGISR
jgi:adenine-specific DNA methylase